MEKLIKIDELIKKVKQSPIAKELIPMEFGSGWPIISIRKGKIAISIPYYKVILCENEKTELYPLYYLITVVLPNYEIIEFSNLKFDKRFSQVDFSAVAGYFRHEGIMNLNKSEYADEKQKLYDFYDELIFSISNSVTFKNEEKMQELFSRLLEPGLSCFYKMLSNSFYERYMMKK